jgi:hypothetical protein
MTKLAPALALTLLGCTDYTVQQIDKPSLPGDTGTFEAEAEEEVFQEVEEDDCIESSTAFDIEEVSTLQDAFGLPDVRDGLTLDVPEELLQGDRTWRPVGVEVLVMVPSWYFEYYDDSNTLSIQVYDGPNPGAGQAYTKSLPIRKAQLEWSPLTLPANADWSGQDRDQMAAWIYFDISDITPVYGFESQEYFVSVGWDGMGFPNVGYSNFNLACEQNWTDYGDGSWRQNTGDDCSWPMFKIDIEQRLPGDCVE